MGDTARATLGDICTLTKGTSPTERTPSGPYSPHRHCRVAENLERVPVRGWAVCIPTVSSRSRACLAEAGSLRQWAVRVGELARRRAGSTWRSARHAGLSLNLNQFKDSLSVPLMRGTANVSLKPNQLMDLPVDLPPLAEQRRIVDLIQVMDDARHHADLCLRCAEAAQRLAIDGA